MNDSIALRVMQLVQSRPDELAIVGTDTSWTYADLGTASDRVVAALLSHGVEPSDLVAVAMERSADLIATVLAILRLRAAYVPLHTDYPLNRIDRIYRRLGRPLVVHDAANASLVAEIPAAGRGVDLGSEVDAQSAKSDLAAGQASDLAYVLFTSGSTGEPKGVEVSNSNVLSLLDDPLWDSEVYRRHLMVSPFAYGMSTFELWSPLSRGHTIVLSSTKIPDPLTLRDDIEAFDVTSVHLTAGLFRVIAEEAPRCLAGLQEVMTGGDTIDPSSVGRFFKACGDTQLRAMYGSTEATLFTSTKLLDSNADYLRVPLGKALAGRELRIGAPTAQAAGAGDQGELFIAGRAVARGYHGDDELTDQVFHGGLDCDERTYRTGDLAYVNEDGDLILQGRVDHQIKVRGFRVEISEVETVLGNRNDVAHVAVKDFVDSQGEKYLVAYIVPRDDLDVATVRKELEADLPDFMVPSKFALMPSLPLNANGKVDRFALVEPPSDQDGPVPVEDKIAAIFGQVLGRSDVGLDSDFFMMDGQSMHAIRIITRLDQELDLRVKIATFYDNPTPRSLASVAARAASGSETDVAHVR